MDWSMDGHTPLNLAARENHEDVVEFLRMIIDERIRWI